MEQGSPTPPDWLALQEAIQSVYAYAASIEGELQSLQRVVRNIADVTHTNARKIRKLKKAKSVSV